MPLGFGRLGGFRFYVGDTGDGSNIAEKDPRRSAKAHIAVDKVLMVFGQGRFVLWVGNESLSGQRQKFQGLGMPSGLGVDCWEMSRDCECCNP